MNGYLIEKGSCYLLVHMVLTGVVGVKRVKGKKRMIIREPVKSD